MLSWYELQFSADGSSDDARHFVRTLAARPRHGLLMTTRPLVCEVEGVEGSLTWRLGVSPEEEAAVLAGLRQALPDLGAVPTERPSVDYDRVWELRVSTPLRALRADHPEQAAGSVLNALQRTGKRERLLLHFVIGPWLPRKAIPGPKGTTGRRTLLNPDPRSLNSEQTRALREKHTDALFGVVGRLAVRAEPHRQRTLRQGVLGGLQLLRAPSVGLERRLIPSFVAKRRLVHFQHPIVAYPIPVNAGELVACLCWPADGLRLPGVEFTGHRHLAPSKAQLVPLAAEPSSRYRITGRSTYPGVPGLLTLKTTDGLRGVHIVGPTGVGKSNFVASLALQDIYAGRGVVVIDPKSDLVQEIGDRIPPYRLDDVVVISATDPSPVGFNVLADGADDWNVDLLIHVLRELYAANWGQRTADVIHNAALTLIKHGGFTLCELVPLLTNATFRRAVTARVRDDVLGVAPFWQWFEALSEPEKAAVTAPVLNKIRAFTGRKALRAIIGQVEGFDLTRVFTEDKILLADTASGDAGADTGMLVSALLMGRLWATIQSRSQIPAARRVPVNIYVDEFADVLRLPGDLGDALGKARGLGAGFCLAHQHMGQLSPSVRAAVEANCRSRVVFQTGYGDGAALAKLLGGGLEGADLQQLQLYETYQALCVDGRTLAPASAQTLPLGKSLGTWAQVQELSRSRYGVARDQTDAALIARRQIAVPDTPVGSRRRSAS